jgi:hypothetical protein
MRIVFLLLLSTSVCTGSPVIPEATEEYVIALNTRRMHDCLGEQVRLYYHLNKWFIHCYVKYMSINNGGNDGVRFEAAEYLLMPISEDENFNVALYKADQILRSGDIFPKTIPNPSPKTKVR